MSTTQSSNELKGEARRINHDMDILRHRRKAVVVVSLFLFVYVFFFKAFIISEVSVDSV